MAEEFSDLQGLVLNASPVGFVALDGSGKIAWSNQAFQTLVGYSATELHGRVPAVDLTHPDDQAEEQRLRREVLFEGRSEFSLQQRYVTKDGRVVWVEVIGKVERDAEGKPTRWAAMVVDLTERKRTESELRAANQRLHDLATQDALTEVLNRRGLEDALHREVARSKRTGDPLTVILVDCDEFKRVNDEFGHAVGDLILREVAWRLRDVLRPMDVVGRIGGDEFMALLPGLEVGLGKVVAERLRLGVGGQPVLANPEPVSVTVSAGLSEVAPSTRSVQELLQLTRLAIRRAKKGGRNQVIGSNTLTNRFEPRAVLATAIGGSLEVFAHALVRLDEDHTEVGHELLIRGPQGPFREPTDLFRLATSEQMGTALDHACLRRSVEVARALRLRGRLHINLLPSTLLAVPLHQLIDDLSDPPEGAQFFIELSEQQYLGDPERLREPLEQLQANGVGVGVDDVGSVVGTLETAVFHPVDFLKIDLRLVMGLADAPARRAQLSRLTRAAAALDVAVFAEGVERPQDLQALKDLGIEFAQGYMWGRPHQLRDNRK